jgi:hypothetical protein
MTGATVVTVPPDLVQPLRDALYSDLQNCVDEAGALVRRRDRGRIQAEVTERFDRAKPIRNLLDVVGWVEPEEGPPPVEVDVRRHHPALRTALLDRLAREEDRLKATAEREPAHTQATGRIQALRGLLDEIAPLAPRDADEREAAFRRRGR